MTRNTNIYDSIMRFYLRINESFLHTTVLDITNNIQLIQNKCFRDTENNFIYFKNLLDIRRIEDINEIKKKVAEKITGVDPIGICINPYYMKNNIKYLKNFSSIFNYNYQIENEIWLKFIDTPNQINYPTHMRPFMLAKKKYKMKEIETIDDTAEFISNYCNSFRNGFEKSGFNHPESTLYAKSFIKNINNNFENYSIGFINDIQTICSCSFVTVEKDTYDKAYFHGDTTLEHYSGLGLHKATINERLKLCMALNPSMNIYTMINATNIASLKNYTSLGFKPINDFPVTYFL